VISNIPIGAKIICIDGSGGKSTAVIVGPVTHKVTHIAVSDQSILSGEERLVPIDRVIKTTRDAIHLDCTTEDILSMEPFTRTHFLETAYGEEGYAYSAPYLMTYPDMTMSPELSYITVKDHLVPEGQVAIHRGMVVQALDGPIGQVGELLIDSTSEQVSHFLLMKGHGWGKKEVAIQVSKIDHGEEETIYLNIDKAQIDQLPSLPVKRAWNEVFATDLELMVWVFEEEGSGKQALQRVQELSTQYAIELLNTTMIVKDMSGQIHIRENKKIPSKRRRMIGLALGGLAGMAIGPVALVAGAIAGAVAGKKSTRRIEVGFSEEKLRKLNEYLLLGGSALVLLIEHRWFHTLQLELSDLGGKMIHERLADINSDELMKKLSSAEDTTFEEADTG